MRKLLLTIFMPLLLVFMFSGQASASTTNQILIKDAEKQGEILTKMLTEFNKIINSGDIVDIDEYYDAFSTQIRKTERTIGRVSGPTTRKNLNEKYVRNAKIARERVIYEVSQLRLMYKIDDLLHEEKFTTAGNEIAKLGRLIRRADEIKLAGGYAALPAQIKSDLNEFEKWVRDYHREGQGIVKTIKDSVLYFNNKDASALANLFDSSYHNISSVESFYQQLFSTRPTMRSDIEYIEVLDIDGPDAHVYVVEKITESGKPTYYIESVYTLFKGYTDWTIYGIGQY